MEGLVVPDELSVDPTGFLGRGLKTLVLGLTGTRHLRLHGDHGQVFGTGVPGSNESSRNFTETSKRG